MKKSSVPACTGFWRSYTGVFLFTIVFLLSFFSQVNAEIWEDFTVWYEGNGADSGHISAEKYKSGTKEIVLKYNEKTEGSSDVPFTRKGCTFVGWCLMEEGGSAITPIMPGGTVWDPVDVPVTWTEDKGGFVFYARWDCNSYSIYYDGNGAQSGQINTQVSPKGSKITIKANGDAAGDVPLVKDGFIFSGWNTKSNGRGLKYAPGTSFTLTDDLRLYAVWTPIPAATATNTAVPTATEVPTSTATMIPTATETPVPTATKVPTSTATMIPTATKTSVPTATNTVVPTATKVPTSTATKVPTATKTSVPAATNTAVPTAAKVPTSTATKVPTATKTSVPTATNTAVPTATQIPTSTATKIPAATKTPVPTATKTAVPTATKVPTSTATKIPAPTNTSVPTVTHMPLLIAPPAAQNTPTAVPQDNVPVSQIAATGAVSSVNTPSPLLIAPPMRSEAMQSTSEPAASSAETTDSVYSGPLPDPFLTEITDIVELPRTGITSKSGFLRSMKPASVQYNPVEMELQIPSLNVISEIVAVEAAEEGYPVEWLGMDAGLLSGTALPGEGFSVLAGHNTLDAETYGPFALIATLEEGERFFIRRADNSLMIFEVYGNEKISEYDFAALYQMGLMYDNTVTLLTCEDERIEGGYASRRIVSAKRIH